MCTAVQNSSRSSHRTKPEKNTARSAHAHARITAGSTTRRRKTGPLIPRPGSRHAAPRSSRPARQPQAHAVAAIVQRLLRHVESPRRRVRARRGRRPSGRARDQDRLLVDERDGQREGRRRRSAAAGVHGAGSTEVPEGWAAFNARRAARRGLRRHPPDVGLTSAPARPEYCAMASRQRLYWALVFALGVGLRLALFSGYGLGDDPNFFQSYSSILRSGRYNPADHYQMRFGLWVPVVGSMRLLGVTEAGFVGAITACSIVNLVLVYLLARQEWDRPWALLAMGLAAVYPLEVLCSTLFAPDMILATYCFTALWLYGKALGAGEGGASRMVGAAASALVLL